MKSGNLRYGAAVFAGVVLASATSGAWAQGYGDYNVDRLLNACVEGDNYARQVGQFAELECNFYLRGFADAAGRYAPEGELCLPREGDYVGDLRRGFMKWGRTHPETGDWPAIKGARAAFACPPRE